MRPQYSHLCFLNVKARLPLRSRSVLNFVVVSPTSWSGSAVSQPCINMGQAAGLIFTENQYSN